MKQQVGIYVPMVDCGHNDERHKLKIRKSIKDANVIQRGRLTIKI